MRTFSYILGSLLIAGLAFAAAAPQKGGEDETGPYEVVPNWPQAAYGACTKSASIAKAIYTWPKFLTAASRSCRPRRAPSAAGSSRRRPIA